MRHDRDVLPVPVKLVEMFYGPRHVRDGRTDGVQLEGASNRGVDCRAVDRETRKTT